MYRICNIFLRVLKQFELLDFEEAVREHKAERHGRGFTGWGRMETATTAAFGRC
jgi:hypothetical protein